MWFMVKLGAFLLVVCYFVWFVLKFLKMKILNTSGNKEPESPEKQSRHRRFGQ